LHCSTTAPRVSTNAQFSLQNFKLLQDHCPKPIPISDILQSASTGNAMAPHGKLKFGHVAPMPVSRNMTTADQ